MYEPSISIVIPVYNSSAYLSLCLEAIRKQKYDHSKIELIIVDAGSKDNTIEIAKKHGATFILENPLKTGEAGKSVGVQHSSNEIIALIDSDNIIEDENWLHRMVQPFRDPMVAASEPWLYTYRKIDPMITRYCALIGMNDPLCLYLGNYDRISTITGRWTDLPLTIEDKGDYLLFSIPPNDVYPTIGANGFLIRRELLLKCEYIPYLFDIDLPEQLKVFGNFKYAKVKIGILHLYALRWSDFIRKQKRRIKDYLFYRDKQLRYYPWQKISKFKTVLFVLKTLLILPVLWDSIKGYSRVKDSAWLFHLPACWITLFVYGSGRLLSLIPGSSQILDRSNWKG